MYELNLTLEILPKALNQTLRFHRYKNHKINLEWDGLIFYKTHGKLPPDPLGSAEVRLCRHSYRMLDYDGLVGSMKPVVDALVTVGVLLNDTWAITGPWIVDQKFRPKKDGPRLEITIRERPTPPGSAFPSGA